MTNRSEQLKLTKLRQEALQEVADAGEAGLGFGRCALRTRKWLREAGLIERLPHKGGFFEPVREVLTPRGAAALRSTQEGAEQ